MSSFRKLTIYSSLVTLALIALGAVVRSTDSGLGCADHWPGCNGEVIPDFTNHHVIIEFSHRVVAGIVMVLIGTLAFKAWKLRPENPRLAPLTIAAFVLVLFQAGLGAVVVKLHLDAESVVLHMTTAVSLLALLVYIAILAGGQESRLLSGPTDRQMSTSARWAAGAVLFLLMVGSYTSGVEGAGRAVNDWPLMDGRVIPDLAIEEKAVHFFHRGVAALVGIILIVTLLSIIRRKDVFPVPAKLAHAALGLFAIEVIIGALNVWTDLNPVVVTLHLIAGASIWLALVGIAIVTSPRFRERLEPSVQLSSRPAERSV